METSFHPNRGRCARNKNEIASFVRDQLLQPLVELGRTFRPGFWRPVLGLYQLNPRWSSFDVHGFRWMKFHTTRVCPENDFPRS